MENIESLKTYLRVTLRLLHFDQCACDLALVKLHYLVEEGEGWIIGQDTAVHKVVFGLEVGRRR